MYKKFSDKIGIKGRVHIKAWEKCPLGLTEELVYERLFDNLIVNVGKDSILKFISGPNLSCCCDSGSADEIGVGSSSTTPALCQTGLQAGACCQLFKVISTVDKVYVRPTTFLSVDFGFSCAIFTWNELGLRDTNDNLWARQVDCTPLVKTTSKRALVEWQLNL